jgi:hypothetical protein
VKLADIIQNFPEFSKECGKAFRCNERALFYSDDVQDDPLSEIEEMSQSDAAILITLLYAHGFKKLHARLTTVTEIYKRRRRWLKVSDRNEQAIIKSRSILNSRFQGLGDSIKTKRAIDPERHRPENYENEWSSLDDMCQLLMDEITHLKNRIHDFDGIHRVRLGFTISLAGIFISVVIGAAGLVVGLANLTKDYWSEPVKPIVRKLFTSPPETDKSDAPDREAPDDSSEKSSPDAPTPGAR